MRKSFLVHLKPGPGGRHCVCCFPAPGSKATRKKFKAAKIAERKAALKDQEIEI